MTCRFVILLRLTHPLSHSQSSLVLPAASIATPEVSRTATRRDATTASQELSAVLATQFARLA
jgi:hypothetical protein